MASKTPPVPPEQQSDIIRGASSPPDTHPETKRNPAGGNKDLNLKEQGRYGDISQNIVNQGRQQDR